MYCGVILTLGVAVLAGVVCGDGQEETRATPPSPWKHDDPQSGKTLLCDWCPPGQRMLTPCTERSLTECVPCGENEYTRHFNHLSECLLCKTCVRYHEHESESCNATADTECECDPGYYLSGDICKAHTKCAIRYGVKQQGSPTSNTECERCKSGTFSDVTSSTEGCKDHTDCGIMGLCVLEKGDRRKDNICGNCSANITVTFTTTIYPPRTTEENNSSEVPEITVNTTASSQIASSTDTSVWMYVGLGCGFFLSLVFIVCVVKRQWLQRKFTELLGRNTQDGQRQSQVDGGVTMQPLMQRPGQAVPAGQAADRVFPLGCCPIRSSPRLRRGVSRNDEDIRARLVTYNDAETIADDVGGAWRQLGRQLGFSDGKLDGFQNDHLYLHEIVYQMLCQWIREKPREATRGKLADALEEVKKRDVARTLLGL